jgi:hypothetical protein
LLYYYFLLPARLAMPQADRIFNPACRGRSTICCRLMHSDKLTKKSNLDCIGPLLVSLSNHATSVVEERGKAISPHPLTLSLS